MNEAPLANAVPGKPVKRWLLALAVAFLVALSSLTTVDRYAEREYMALFQRALVTFALARTLNGIISAAQGTEVALQPAGVGITLTPGELLDPVNDLVERFSWIMLGATISLGVQQVLLDVGQWWALRLLLALLATAWLYLRLRRSGSGPERVGGFERALARSLVVVVFLRFAVPGAVIANEALYNLFLAKRYAQSAQVVETAGAEIEQSMARDLEPPEQAGAEAGEETGLLERLGRSLGDLGRAVDFRQRLERVRQRAGDMVEHLVQLSVVFILQTALLPLTFLWAFLQIFKQVFRSRY